MITECFALFFVCLSFVLAICLWEQIKISREQSKWQKQDASTIQRLRARIGKMERENWINQTGMENWNR